MSTTEPPIDRRRAGVDTSLAQMIAAMDRQSQALEDLNKSYRKSTRFVPWLMALMVAVAIVAVVSLAAVISIRAVQSDNHSVLSILEQQTSPAQQKANASAVAVIETQVDFCVANIVQRQGEAFRHLPLVPVRPGCPSVPVSP